MTNIRDLPWANCRAVDGLKRQQPYFAFTRKIPLLNAVLGLLFFQCALAGCAGIDKRPEVNPDKWAPPKVTDEWVPTDTVMRQYTVENTQPGRPVSAVTQPGTVYDLSGLIDIALRNSPQTRRQWQVARSAADEFGAAQAPYYPQVDMQSGQGYQRTILELPAAVGKLEQWQAQPAVELTYILLDFGRRRSAAEVARNSLIASNFAFNRGIQNVVFSTQSAFYSIDATHAAVSAAQQNLELAQTDFDAVK